MKLYNIIGIFLSAVLLLSGCDMIYDFITFNNETPETLYIMCYGWDSHTDNKEPICDEICPGESSIVLSGMNVSPEYIVEDYDFIVLIMCNYSHHSDSIVTDPFGIPLPSPPVDTIMIPTSKYESIHHSVTYPRDAALYPPISLTTVQ